MNIRDYIKAGLHYKAIPNGRPAWNTNPNSYDMVKSAINMGAKTAKEMAQKTNLTNRQIQPILWRMKRRGMVELVHHWEAIKGVPELQKGTDWEKVEKLLKRKPRGRGELQDVLGCSLSHLDDVLQHMRRAGCVRVVHYWKVVG